MKRYKIDYLSKYIMQHSAIVAKKTLSPEDSALFRQTIGKVKPLKSDHHKTTARQKPKPYPQKVAESIHAEFDKTTDLDLETLYQEDRISFIAPGLQKNVLKKLRKGHFGLDASIDLHGLTSKDAEYQLLRFLHFSVEEGCRCVHIIHGKGYRSPDKQPVLKNHINLWLRQHNDVQAFCSTPSKDGGAGAIFVLLKLSTKYSDESE